MAWARWWPGQSFCNVGVKPQDSAQFTTAVSLTM